MTKPLKASDVPLPGADWRAVETFALTLDGAGALGGAKALDELVARHFAAGTLPTELLELRAFLFFEQRRFRHYGHAPRGEERARIDRILARIADAAER